MKIKATIEKCIARRSAFLTNFDFGGLFQGMFQNVKRIFKRKSDVAGVCVWRSTKASRADRS